jgi:hypothetical protein
MSDDMKMPSSHSFSLPEQTLSPLLSIWVSHCWLPAQSPRVICSHVYSTFKSQGSLAYRSFYVISIFEITTNIAVSSKWKAVTFKGTHLVQRMSLLTLIILGEGVMTIVQKITTVHIYILLYPLNRNLI